MDGKKSALILDACTPTVQVGLWHAGSWKAFYRSEDPALQALFLGVDSCLKHAQMTLKEIEQTTYCEGPGSVLGMRLTAMALTTWQKAIAQLPDFKIFSYSSLNAGAEILKASQNLKMPCWIIAPARQGRWHVLHLKDDIQTSSAVELEAEALHGLQGDIYYLPSKKLSKAIPPHALPLPYDFQARPEIFNLKHWITPQNTPILYSQNDPEYARWSGERHR